MDCVWEQYENATPTTARSEEDGGAETSDGDPTLVSYSVLILEKSTENR